MKLLDKLDKFNKKYIDIIMDSFFTIFVPISMCITLGVLITIFVKLIISIIV